MNYNKMTDVEILDAFPTNNTEYTLKSGIFWALDYEARPAYPVDRKIVINSLKGWENLK